MSVPYHVQIYPKNGAIFRGFFYKYGREFALLLEDDDGKKHDGGKWSSISEADEWARLMAADIVGNSSGDDPLAKYRGSGHLLLVTFDGHDGKWAVVAGNRRNGRYEDTQLRFNSQAEARRLIDAVCREL
jgi:hypothetical protein